MLAVGQADADGRYYLTVPVDFPTWEATRIVRVLAAGSGAAPSVVVVPVHAGETAMADVGLGTSLPFCGQVRGSAGEPVPGVRVTVIRIGPVARDDADGDSLAGWPHVVTTDAQGRFELAGTDPSRGIWVRLDDGKRGLSVVKLPTVQTPQDIPHVWTLTAAREIVGRVVFADTGKPVPNANVSLCAIDRQHAREFADGHGQSSSRRDRHHNRPRWPLLPSLTPTVGDQDLLVSVVPPSGSGYLGLSRRVRPDEPSEVPFPGLPRGVVVRGRVVDADGGAGVTGTLMTADITSDNSASQRLFEDIAPRAGLLRDVARTDTNGRFALTTLPGAGFVAAYGPTNDFVPISVRIRNEDGVRDYAHGAALVAAAPPGQDPPGVQVKIRHGTVLSAPVEGPGGQPIGNGAVLLAAGRMRLIQPSRVRPIPIVNRRLELPGCQMGKTYPVVVHDPTRRLGAVADLTLAANRVDAANPFAFRPPARDSRIVLLQPCGAARIRFVGPTDEPVAAVTALLWLDLGLPFPTDTPPSDPRPADRHMLAETSATLQSDTDGWLSVEGLVPGALYTLMYFFGGRVGGTASFVVTAGGTVRLPVVVLPASK